MTFGRFLIVPLVVLLCACGGKPPLATGPDITLANLSQLPAPISAGPGGDIRSYEIGPYDLLAIDVFGLEEFSREMQVDISGHIGFPLAGSISVAGKTPAQVADEIERELRRNFVRDPRVTVTVKQLASALVTVEGVVRRPGNYPVLGNMTLMRSIASAQGLDEFADVEDVVVFRTVQGTRYAALYNLEAIRRGNMVDPAIYPDDIVVVGESSSRRLFDSLLRLAPLITAPIVVIANNN